MSVWPPEGSPLAVTPEMEQAMKKMNYPVIKQCDMKEEMRAEVVDAAVGAMEKYSNNMELACKQCKADLDKKFGAPWHCVAGEGFGFTITYEAQHLCYVFFAGTGRRLAMLCFKSCQV